MAGLWFGILGPVEVRAAGVSPIAVGGPRPRALLALLSLEAGHVVGTAMCARRAAYWTTVNAGGCGEFWAGSREGSRMAA